MLLVAGKVRGNAHMGKPAEPKYQYEYMHCNGNSPALRCKKGGLVRQFQVDFMGG